MFRFINTGTGAHISSRVIPQENSFNGATASMYANHYGMCCDSSGNYMLSFESANEETYLEGYNSNDVLQWTKKLPVQIMDLYLW